MDYLDYARQLKTLLPRGLAWAVEEDSNLFKLLLAWGFRLSDFEARAYEFLNNFFPDTTVDFITDWERVAGLPDSCSGLGATIAIRQKDLVAKLAAQGGQTPQYYIDLAAKLGYTVTITEFNPFRASVSAAGDPCCDITWNFAWQVNAPLNTIEYFRASINSAGDALALWGNTRLECFMKKFKPAHTVVLFSYT